VSGNLSKEREQWLWKTPIGPEPSVERVKLFAIGQVAMKEKKCSLLVRDSSGQVFDSIPAILEYARTISTFDVGDRGLTGNDSL
jgi:hypothetical protein